MAQTGNTAMVTKDIIVGDYVSVNNELVTLDSPQMQPCYEISSDPRVYEVIRVIKSKVVFFEDHLERLKNSFAKIEEYKNMELSIEKIYQQTYELIKKLNIEIGNIRIVVSRSQTLIHQRVHNYPSQELVKKGIVLGELEIVRHDPNVKSMREDYIKQVQIAHQQEFFGTKVFEVLLLNEQHCYTEGSRSNVFFLNSEELRTAPDSEVLKGITRKYVLQAAESIGLKINQKSLHKDELQNYKAFLSGTSLNVLPIYSIGNVLLDSANDKTIIQLLDAYLKIVESYLDSH